MSEHYIVTLDGGHLRIYAESREPGERSSRLQVVESVDFPLCSELAMDGSGENEDSSAARDHGAGSDRLTSFNRIQSGNVHMLATELNSFMQNRPSASWDFAAPEPVYSSVIDELSPETTRRIQRSLSKDLVNENAEDVRAHFGAPR